MDEIIDRLRKVRKGAMFIIEAPSGTGKGTVIKEFLKKTVDWFWLFQTISHTMLNITKTNGRLMTFQDI